MSVKKKRVAGRPGRPSKYGPEFQRDAVAMVLDQGRSVGDVARALGVNDGLGLISVAMSVSSSANCDARLASSEWNEICSNDLWPSG
jgi:Transposase